MENTTIKTYETDRKRAFGAEAIGALIIVLCTAFTSRLGVDYAPHVKAAADLDFSNLPEMFARHSEPMWHSLARLVAAILPIPLRYGGYLVSCLAMLAAFLIAVHYLKNEVGEGRKTQAVIFTTILYLVSALYVPFFNKYPYLGQGTPNIWHNPTQIMLRPFMVLFFIILTGEIKRIRETDFTANVSVKTGIWMAVILVMTNLAKPSFIQIFFPGIFFMMLCWLVRYHGRNFKMALQLVLVCLPSLFVFILQYLAIFKSGHGKGGGIAIMPFVAARAYTPSVTISFILLFAFPIAMLIIAARRKMLDEGNELSLWMLLMGFLMKILLAETGKRIYSGNFGWGYLAAATLVWYIAMRDYLRIFVGEGKEKGSSRTIANVLLGLHFISGIYYLIYLIVFVHGV